MKNINNFNDFKVDMLFENIRNNITELPFILSVNMRNFLKKINHPISKELLKINNNRNEKKFTFIDLDNEKWSPNDTDINRFKRFSIINSNKAYDELHFLHPNMSIKDLKNALKSYDFYTDQESSFVNKNRVLIRIGAFVKKVFGDKFKDGGDPGNDIESFVNTIVAYRTNLRDEKENRINRFELVSGNDIVKYYNYKTYYSENGENGSLFDSCMRYDRCGDYMKFYSKNSDSVKMLILKSIDNEKIIGRSLVWELQKPSGRTFMDRIYTIDESDVELFKLYAKNNGWLHKKRQNNKVKEEIIDTIDNSSNNILLSTKNNIEKNKTYPYMDTLLFYNIDSNYLTNNYNEVTKNNNNFYELRGTNGNDHDVHIVENDEDESIYVDYYDRSFDEDELQWCEFGDEYRTHEDAHQLGEDYEYMYTTRQYINQNMLYSEIVDNYIHKNDAVWSSYNQSYIHRNNSIDVINNSDFDTFVECLQNNNSISIKDIRDESELGNSVFHYYINNNNINEYYFDLEKNKNNFIECEIIGKYYTLYKHKIWDKDKIIEKSGTYYYTI